MSSLLIMTATTVIEGLLLMKNNYKKKNEKNILKTVRHNAMVKYTVDFWGNVKKVSVRNPQRQLEVTTHFQRDIRRKYCPQERYRKCKTQSFEETMTIPLREKIEIQTD